MQGWIFQTCCWGRWSAVYSVLKSEQLMGGGLGQAL